MATTKAKPKYPPIWDKWAADAIKPYSGDPKLLIAIACLESDYGRSLVASNNLHGIRRSVGNGFRTFESGADSFGNVAYLLYQSSYYADARKVELDIDRVGKVYCNNDPLWSRKVRAILRGL